MTESTEPTILDTLTTDELWKELQSRFTDCVLIFECDVPGQINSKLAANGVWWKSTFASALGLCEYAKLKFIEDIKRWINSDE